LFSLGTAVLASPTLLIIVGVVHKLFFVICNVIFLNNVDSLSKAWNTEVVEESSPTPNEELMTLKECDEPDCDKPSDGSTNHYEGTKFLNFLFVKPVYYHLLSI